VESKRKNWAVTLCYKSGKAIVVKMKCQCARNFHIRLSGHILKEIFKYQRNLRKESRNRVG